MATPFDDLPSWLAVPVVRALPEEEPTPADLLDVVQSLAELLAVRVLAELTAEGELPPVVEGVLRHATGRAMGLSHWIEVLEALQGAGALELLGLGAPHPAVEAWAASLGCDTGVVAVLSASSRAPSLAPCVVPGAAALARSARGLTEQPLSWIKGADGEAVRSRVLMGTDHPAVVRTSASVALEPGRLYFWDGDQGAVLVPQWLARWDERSRELHLFAGRDVASGKFLFRGAVTRQPFVEVPAEDAPQALVGVGWATPAPAARQVLPGSLEGPAAQPSEATQQMAQARAAVPPARPSTPPASQATGQLILRVLCGRYVLRYGVISPSQPVVIGRSAQFSNFVLHHHQVSRAHSKVRMSPDGQIFASDMGSTNGTQVNGQEVPKGQEVRVDPGDIVGVGPLLLRLEWATPLQIERLDQILQLTASPKRDILTRLLLPRYLIEELPEPLRGSFRSGGPQPPGAPPLCGVLLYIDRLNAVHAQHGEQLADAVFAVASRVIQYASDRPLAVVRVGYGEVLVPVVGGSSAQARLMAEGWVKLLEELPWEVPLRKMTMTACVIQKAPEEGAQRWLHRGRKLLQQGRSHRGRGQVYTE